MQTLLIFLFVSALPGRSDAAPGKDRSIAPEQLPQKAKQFIETYFPDSKISLVKEDRELFDAAYKVIFTNGDKVEFNSKGRWTDANCQYSRLPEGVAPLSIREYIRQHLPGEAILRIKFEKKIYAVYLTNEHKLYFDHHFRAIPVKNLIMD